MEIKIGLFIGRFQPFHNGHYEAIRRTFDYVDQLKVAIGSAQFSKMKSNPWTFNERKCMIENTLKSNKQKLNVKIYRLDDIGDPYEWVNYVYEKIGKFDILFSGNVDGVIDVFQKAELEDRPDTIIIGTKERIRGTAIRKQIYGGVGKYNTDNGAIELLEIPRGTWDVIHKSKNHIRFTGGL